MDVEGRYGIGMAYHNAPAVVTIHVVHWGHGRRQRGDRGRLWIFLHDTDKVKRGLMLLFFGLVFSFGPPGNFFADALD